MTSITEAMHRHLAEPLGYDRARLHPGIVHLGMGNFHRAHQASIFHELMETGAGDWMIQGVGMLASDEAVVQAMRSQDGLYSLTELSGWWSPRLRVIGAIRSALLAPREPAHVIEAMAASATEIISLTITEGGYHSTPSGDLDESHPQIQADLRAGAAPQTGIGYLFAGLAARSRGSQAPVTVLSCDNLLGNGALTRRLVLQFAELKDPEAGRWIRDHQHVSFPSSMVDRITPASTPAGQAFVESTFGIVDRCPVLCESYRQWVIEDAFAGKRPPFERLADVTMVDEVGPYEKLKMRLLNGSHSALAYISYLMGYRKVDEAISDPLVRTFVRQYMDQDVTPTLPAVAHVDVEAYKDQLLQRFANPAISDQVERLAKDGSAKFAVYVVPVLTQQLEAGGSIAHLAFALAAWARYLSGRDEQGNEVAIDDATWARLERPIATAGDLLGMNEIFGPELAGDRRLIAALDEDLARINQLGVGAALAELVARGPAR